MRTRHGAFATGNYSPVPGANGGGAATALATLLANNAVAFGALGPATTISHTITNFPSLDGSLVISAFMNVEDATPGELVQFTLRIQGLPVLGSNAIADAAGYATVTFPYIGSTSGGPITIEISATAAHNLTSAAGRNFLMVTQLPN
jgi:hypothetical protein